MNWIDALILGIIQGITEFLPISSTGHLVLMQHYLGLEVEKLMSFDVIVHAGTLLAILLYFWRDVWGLTRGFFGLFLGRFNGGYPRLIGLILIGTVPAVVAGFTLKDWIESGFREVSMVGGAMFAVGVLFVVGEFAYKRARKEVAVLERARQRVDEVRDTVQPGGFVAEELRGMTWWRALIIGCFQAVALVPGVSRSGSTIVAGLFQGIKRDTAARFSFLLGIPAIAGAALLTGLDMLSEPQAIELSMEVLLVGFVTSFVFGLASVWFLMNFLKKHSLIIFAVYLIAMGLFTFL